MQNSMYYTNSGLASLPEYQGGGYIDQYGRQRYGLGKLVKKITKPIANVLDKVVPNEIKPALPYLAAFAPFMFPGFTAGLGSMLGASGTIGGLSIPSMVGAGVLKAGADLSQEGAAERGLRLPSLAATVLSAGLSTPGSFEALGGNQILGNISPSFEGIDDLRQLGYNTSAANQAFTAADAANVIPTFGPEGSMLPPNSILTPPTTLQNAQNLVTSGLQSGAKFLEVPEGGVSFLNDPLGASKTLAIPAATTFTEQAYNAAIDANKKYQQQQALLGGEVRANRQAQIDYIRSAMQTAGFTEDEISSAITRSGFAGGGKAEYGLMNLKMGGMPVEMDLRAKGGFVPIGRKERADDVPARLSKNEFVFTAKAVKNAGGGDVRKGAKRMYQIMNQLEARA